jgi:feruloyl esterase
VLKAVMSGPLTSSGTPFKSPGYKTVGEFAVPGYRVDPGWMAPSGQSTRLFGTETALPGDFGLGVYPTPYLHMTPPQPSFNPITDVNWDTWGATMTVDAPWLMADPDISAFRKRKGKILFYHGTGDPGPNIVNTINYYEQMAALNGGVAETTQFARLFMVPAMGHCGSGPSTDSFDRLKPMVDWVEQGIAPDAIVASARAGNTDLNAVTPVIPANRTRPLCPYPKHAQYKGSGNVDDAANFACQ